MRKLSLFDPTDEFNYLQNRINNIFNESMRFLRDPSDALSAEEWGPSVDIRENDENYELHADLPGMKKEDINIDLQGNVLRLSGERKHESEHSEGKEVRIERSYGKFERSFTLPQNVDIDNIHATYDNGILKLVLPKKEETRPRQITVES